MLKKLLYSILFCFCISAVMRAQAGKSFSFDNAISDIEPVLDYKSSFIEIDGYDGITGTNSRTFECWIKTGGNYLMTSSVTMMDMPLATWGEYSPGMLFNVCLNADTSQGVYGAVKVKTGLFWITGNVDVMDDQWHHIAVTAEQNSDGTLYISDFEIYVDGVQVGTSDMSGGIVYTIGNSKAYIAHIPEYYGEFVNTFDGLMDEVRIWSVYRCGNEIAADMHRTFDSPMPSGLEVYYKLNQGTGDANNQTLPNPNTVIDDSGFGRDGTLYSPDSNFGNTLLSDTGDGLMYTFDNWKADEAYAFTSFSYSSLTPSKALDFGGADDHTKTPGYTGVTGSNNRTVEFWIKTTDNTKTIVAWGANNLGEYFSIGIGALGRVVVFDGVGGVSGTTAINTGVWTHVAVVFKNDGSPDINECQLFVNGVSDAVVGSVSHTLGTVSGETLTLGSDLSFVNAFVGRLDEFRIWSRPLCEGEILLHKSCKLEGDENGLQVYYQFDQAYTEPACYGTIEDISLYGRNAVLRNFALLGGTTSNWVTDNSPASSLCTTAYVPSSSAEVRGMGITIADGDVTPNPIDNTDFGDTPLNAPVIHNFTIFNPSAGPITISEITFAGQDYANFSYAGITLPLTLAAGASEPFVMVFDASNVGLSQAQVSFSVSNLNCADAPYNFSIRGNVVKAADALHFDGVNDYISTTYQGVLGTDSRTVEFWVKTTDAVGTFVTWGGTGPGGLFSIDINTDTMGGGVGGALRVSTATGRIIGTEVINDGNWHHVAVSYLEDSNPALGDCVIYIDAAEDIISKLINSPINTVSTVPVTIGRKPNGTAALRGVIDEFRIWARSLCFYEIAQHYQCEFGASADPGLVLEYQFNRGNSEIANPGINTVPDNSGLGHLGTLNNFALDGHFSNWTWANVVNLTCTPLSSGFQITGNGVVITNNDITPQVPDNTNYDLVNMGSSATRNFVITNLSTIFSMAIDSIIFVGGSDSMFAATAPVGGATGPFSNGNPQTVSIEFTPLTPGYHYTDVEVHTHQENCDHYVHYFRIAGMGFKQAEALDFDGVNDYVDSQYPGILGAADRTLEIWVQTTATTGCMISYGSTAANGNRFDVTINNGTNGVAGAMNINVGGGSVVGTAVINDGNWHHLAVVFENDGTPNVTDCRLFVDGVYDPISYSVSRAINTVAAVDMRFGKTIAGTNFFNGRLDEMRLWDRALCVSEILAYKNCETIPASNYPGLVDYIQFNQGNANSPNPGQAGLAPVGTLYNFLLDSDTSNWVWPGAIPFNTFCGVMSTNVPVIELRGSGNAIPNGDITPSTTDNTDYGTVIGITPLAHVFNIRNTGTAALSVSNITISGAPAGTFVVSGITFPANVGANNSRNFTITFNPSATGTYTATVTVASSDCVTDFYTFRITATCMVPGASLNVENPGNYISSNYPGILGTGGRTTEFWIKTTDPTGTICSWGLSPWYRIGLNNGKVHYSGQGTVKSTNTVNDGNWHHIAVVLHDDGSANANETQIYIDGILEVNTAVGGAVINTANPTNDPNGYLLLFAWDDMPAEIDEFRIWSRGLCQEEIQAQKDCELTGIETNLELYYKFNRGNAGADNSGISTVPDAAASSGSHTGTLANFTLDGATSNWQAPGGVTVGTTCSPFYVPAVHIEGNGVAINDGDVTPSVTDDTDFGVTALTTPIVHNFTLINTGSGTATVNTLTLTGSSDFSLAGITLPTTLAAGASVNFTVTFTPTIPGTNTATISLNATNTGCLAPAYNFNVQGVFVSPASALSFDGNNDYVSTSYSGILGTNSRTVEFWFKIPNAPAEMGILSWGTAAGQAWDVYMTNTGKIELNVNGAKMTTTPAYDDNTWHHCAIVLMSDGTPNIGEVKIYIDGAAVATNSPNQAINTVAGGTLKLGRKLDGTKYLNGWLDEVRIWDRALCLPEIQANKNCELNGTESGLVVYYQFNEGLGNNNNAGINTLPDIAGANQNGTLNNFALNGTNSNWVAPGAVTNGNICTPFAIAEINVQGNGFTILDEDVTPNSTDNSDFGLVNVGSLLNHSFTIQNTGTAPLTINSITKSGTDAAMFIRYGITLPITIAAGGSTTFTMRFTPTSTGIKTATFSLNSDDCDEAVYNFVVQGEGYLQGAALDFDGTNDYVATSYTGILGTADRTFEAWIKTTTNDKVIMSYGTNNPGNCWLLRVNTSGLIEVKVNNGRAEGSTVVDDGVWHHIAVTFTNDGTPVVGDCKIYVDGVLNTNTVAQGQAVNTLASNNLRIGSDIGGGDFFLGQIDEVRVWNRVLCPAEIGEQRHCELSGTESGLVAYYNCNNGNAAGNNPGVTTLADIAGANQNGTLTNFALTGATSNWVLPGGVITGTSCAPFVASEIAVSGLAVNIVDGDNTPSTTDATDLGAIGATETTNSVFTIQNMGTTPLVVGNIYMSGTAAADYSISGITFPATIAVGGSTTFTLTFDGTALGTRNAVVNIESNDCDEYPFNFSVTALRLKVTDVRGSMVTFDGVDDAIDCGLPLLPTGANSTFTIEAWIKTTANNCAILGQGATGNGTIRVRINNNRLSYSKLEATNVTINGTSIINDGTWHHIAVVKRGSGTDRIELYVDGVLEITGTDATANLNTTNTFWGKRNNAGSPDFFAGTLDELRIWSAARSQNLIRENMHLTLKGTETGMLAYYQLNSDLAAGTAGGVVDGFGVNDGTTLNMTAAAYSNSETPVAGGVSQRMTINAAGTYSFATPGVNITFTGASSHPNGELVISRLRTEYPHGYSNIPQGDVDNEYFVVRNYGTDLTLNVTSMTFTGLSYIDAADVATPNVFRVYKRNSNDYGNTWGLGIANASSAIASPTGTLTFTGAPLANSFSQFAIATATSSASGLPIELLSFDATRISTDKVKLDWATATEINNYGFEIERMLDNETVFSTIGFVEGYGNSTATVNYGYHDPNAYTGISYYRLRQLDFDGKVSYSEIRAVSGLQADNSAPIILYPNPTKGAVTVRFGNLSAAQTSAQVRVLDMRGVPVQAFEVATAPYQSFAIDAHDLPSAAYLVEIRLNTGEQQMLRFIRE